MSLFADLEELALLASASRVGASAFLTAGGAPALVAALRAASVCSSAADGGGGDGGEEEGGGSLRTHRKKQRRRRLRPRLVLAALRASRALYSAPNDPATADALCEEGGFAAAVSALVVSTCSRRPSPPSGKGSRDGGVPSPSAASSSAAALARVRARAALALHDLAARGGGSARALVSAGGLRAAASLLDSGRLDPRLPPLGVEAAWRCVEAHGAGSLPVLTRSLAAVGFAGKLARELEGAATALAGVGAAAPAVAAAASASAPAASRSRRKVFPEEEQAAAEPLLLPPADPPRLSFETALESVTAEAALFSFRGDGDDDDDEEGDDDDGDDSDQGDERGSGEGDSDDGEGGTATAATARSRRASPSPSPSPPHGTAAETNITNRSQGRALWRRPSVSPEATAAAAEARRERARPRRQTDPGEAPAKPVMASTAAAPLLIPSPLSLFRESTTSLVAVEHPAEPAPSSSGVRLSLFPRHRTSTTAAAAKEAVTTAAAATHQLPPALEPRARAAFVDRAANLLLVVSCGDPGAKRALADPPVCSALLRLLSASSSSTTSTTAAASSKPRDGDTRKETPPPPRNPLAHLTRRLLRTLKNIAEEPSTADPLGAAGAVQALVPHAAAVSAASAAGWRGLGAGLDALGALSSLCRGCPARLAQAAAAGGAAALAGILLMDSEDKKKEEKKKKGRDAAVPAAVLAFAAAASAAEKGAAAAVAGSLPRSRSNALARTSSSVSSGSSSSSRSSRSGRGSSKSDRFTAPPKLPPEVVAASLARARELSVPLLCGMVRCGRRARRSLWAARGADALLVPIEAAAKEARAAAEAATAAREKVQDKLAERLKSSFDPSSSADSSSLMEQLRQAASEASSAAQRAQMVAAGAEAPAALAALAHWSRHDRRRVSGKLSGPEGASALAASLGPHIAAAEACREAARASKVVDKLTAVVAAASAAKSSGDSSQEELLAKALSSLDLAASSPSRSSRHVGRQQRTNSNAAKPKHHPDPSAANAARALGPLLRLLSCAGRVPRAAAAAGLVDGCLQLLSSLCGEPLAALPLLDAVAAMYAAASSPRAFIAAHGPRASLRRIVAGCGGGGGFADNVEEEDEVEVEEEVTTTDAVDDASGSSSESDSDDGSGSSSSSGDDDDEGEERARGSSPSPSPSRSPPVATTTATAKDKPPLVRSRKTSPPVAPVFSNALTAGETEVRARAHALLNAFRVNAAL